jgi:uncharacterized membrane protein
MDNNIMIQFYQFGKHMHTAAIATVLALIPPITPFAGLIAIIFLFSALGDIKTLNYQLFNANLEGFRKNYIRSIIAVIFGIILLFGGAIVLGVFLGIPLATIEFFVIGFPITITGMVTGVILFIVSSTFQMKAWENLKIYFMTNKSLFPEHIRHEIIQGSDLLRTGALLWAFGMFIITAIVGWILQAVGYFKLAKLSELMYYEKSQPQMNKTIPQVLVSVAGQPNINATEVKDFCPNCGSKLDIEGKFCPVCGSEI